MSSARFPILDPNPTATRRELPTVRSLQQLWDEVSSRPLWAPPHFFRYLKLRHQIRLRLLDPDRVPVFAPEGKVNDCSSCRELCCVGPRNTVLLRLRAIATLIDLERTELMVSQKPSFSEDELRGNPALRLQVASDDWHRFPVLKQNTYGMCRALDPDGRCTLFPHWPMSCERFPYMLDIEARELSYSPRCRSFWIRPDAKHAVSRMRVSTVAAYNERIKDRILLAYAPARLAQLGVMKFLL